MPHLLTFPAWTEQGLLTDGPTKGAFATPAYETKGGCDLSAAVQNRHKKPDFLAGRFFALADDVIGPEKKNLAGDITRYIEAAGGAMADPAKTRPVSLPATHSARETSWR